MCLAKLKEQADFVLDRLMMKVSNPKLLIDIEKELDEFIKIIEGSIHDYLENNNYVETEEVADWKNRVVKNLKNYRAKLVDALEKYKKNDSDNLQGIASMIASLPKDLDNFSNNWMPTKWQDTYEAALDQVTETAYIIKTDLYGQE